MKRSVKLVLGALGTLAVPALAGCGGGGGGQTTDPITIDPSRPSIQAGLPNGLTAIVTEDTSSVPVGGVVTYTLVLANNTAQPITFQPVRLDSSPSSGIGDALTIKDAKGNIVFPQGAALQVVSYGPAVTLATGQAASGTVVVGADKSVGQFSAAGKYSASVKFTTLAATGAVPTTGTVGPLEVDAQ